MDALVDRLIERLEAGSRWGHRVTRRAFDACTSRLSWENRLVLRQDLAGLGRLVRDVSLTLGGALWLQISYCARFIAGPHPDPHDSLFRLFWAVFAIGSVVVDLVAVVYAVFGLLMLGLILVRSIQNGSWRHPWRALQRCWQQRRDRLLEHWATHHPALLVAEEQAELQRVWDRARTMTVGMDGSPGDATARATQDVPPPGPARRRL